MTYGVRFILPAGPGTRFSRSAADGLIGQKVVYKDRVVGVVRYARPNITGEHIEVKAEVTDETLVGLRLDANHLSVAP